MTRKQAASSHQSMSDGERITDPIRIARLLQRLAKRRTLITIEIPGHAEHYTSCIVGFDGPCVLLDELVPPAGHQQLLAERKMRITGKLDGIDLEFTTSLERVDDRDDTVTYHATLPERLEYLQRRLYYRAHIPIAQRLRVIIETSNGIAIKGLLHDLSHGGAGIMLAEGTPTLESGSLCECAIELPDAAWLYCTVEICHKRRLSLRNQQLVGSKFIGLSPAQTQLVRRHITALERKLIRNRAAY